jgi:hypothetical protein
VLLWGDRAESGDYTVCYYGGDSGESGVYTVYYAIGMLRIISERNLVIDEELCACFIDWQIAFDRVNWTKLMQILKGIRIDWSERRLISKLYMEQSVKIRLDQGETRSVKIGRGVRQVCCLSPILFNLYSEYCAGTKARHSTEIRQTIPYTPYNHKWTVPSAPFLSYPLPFGIRPEFTCLAVGSYLNTLHPGSELRATNSGLGPYSKILFRQGWQ